MVVILQPDEDAGLIPVFRHLLEPLNHRGPQGFLVFAIVWDIRGEDTHERAAHKRRYINPLLNQVNLLTVLGYGAAEIVANADVAEWQTFAHQLFL